MARWVEKGTSEGHEDQNQSRPETKAGQTEQGMAHRQVVVGGDGEDHQPLPGDLPSAPPPVYSKGTDGAGVGMDMRVRVYARMEATGAYFVCFARFALAWAVQACR